MDVNQDDIVSSRDILVVINALARSEEASETLDVNFDGRVSALDALLLINELHRTGGQSMLVPVSDQDIEAQHAAALNFASNVSTEALPENELIDLVAEDFARIAASYTDLNILVYAPSPGSISVSLTAEDVADFDAGQFHRLDDLNTELSVESITRNRNWGHPDLSQLILTFAKPYHWNYLRQRYAAVDGVRGASHPTFSGIGGPYGIEITDPRTDDGARVYNFQFGFGDCPAGCIDVDIKQIRVTDRSVARFENPLYVPLPF